MKHKIKLNGYQYFKDVKCCKIYQCNFRFMNETMFTYRPINYIDDNNIHRDDIAVFKVKLKTTQSQEK